jgi:hypothetical protein
MRAPRGVASVLGLLLATLGGCGGAKSEIAAAADPLAQSTRYDVYLIGIEPALGGGTALYGLNLDPLQTHRLAVDPAWFGPTAHGEQVVVEGGNGSHLGLLQPDGTVGPIPGLGQPEGDSPELLADGRVRWSDTGGPKDKDLRRFLEWSPATKKTKVLDQVQSSKYVEFASGPGDGYLKALETKPGRYELSVVTAKKTWTHKLPSQPLTLSAGRDWIAAWVDNVKTSTKSDHLLLAISPSKGVVKELKGMQPIAWSPGGRRLLAAAEGAAGKPVTLREIWFDPGAVANRDIGEIPAMEVESGAWRAGMPKALCPNCADRPTFEKDY